MLAGHLACSLLSLIALAACSPGSSGPVDHAAPSAALPAPSASSATAATPALVPEASTTDEAWKHPGMGLAFSYPQRLFKVSPKPDGATLTSAVLGIIEDRSDQGKDRPSPMVITISVRVGPLLDVMKSSRAVLMSEVFPAGTEASFKEQKGFAERLTVSGHPGYMISSGSHDVFEDRVYASLAARSTLEVTCAYVGDMAKPTVAFSTQKAACERVLATLLFKP